MTEKCPATQGAMSGLMLVAALSALAAVGLLSYDYITGDEWTRTRMENFNFSNTPTGFAAKVTTMFAVVLPIVGAVVSRIPTR